MITVHFRNKMKLVWGFHCPNAFVITDLEWAYWKEKLTHNMLSLCTVHKFIFFSNNLNWIVIDEMFNGWPCYLVQVVPNSLRWLKSFWSNFKFVIRIKPLAQTNIAQIYITLFYQQNILNISSTAVVSNPTHTNFSVTFTCLTPLLLTFLYCNCNY